MTELVLRRAYYHRQMQPLIASGASPIQIQEALGEHFGTCIAEAFYEWDAPPPAIHYLCSTMVDFPFSTGAIEWRALSALVARHSPFGPATLVNGYECASWGYALRHGLRFGDSDGRIAISIVDLNLLNLEFWKENPNWGASGFGTATLVFDAAPNAVHAVTVDYARTHNVVAEFALAMRNVVKTATGVRLAKPFFPENITQVFMRQMPHADHLPDEHPVLGHCFGSDPWISIIRDAVVQPEGRSYLAASTALNGYWALARVRTVHDGRYFMGDAP